MRFAYADPPYPGQAHLYKRVDANACEVNHPLLIRHLCDEFPDGWALSTSSPALEHVLRVCRDVMGDDVAKVRIGSWVKPFASFKPGVTVAYAWEPVLFQGGAAPHTAATDRQGLGFGQHHTSEGHAWSKASAVLALAVRTAEHGARRRVSRPVPRLRWRRNRMGRVDDLQTVAIHTAVAVRPLSNEGRTSIRSIGRGGSVFGGRSGVPGASPKPATRSQR